MSTVDQTSFTYSGRDNLEAMRHAHHYNAFLTQLILSNAPLNGQWLDFGAGAGQFAIPLSQAGHDIMAVEVDAGLAKKIELSGVKTHTNLSDIAESSIDYAYSLNVLEHIFDHDQALSLLYKKMKSGGTLLIYVPAFQILYSSMDKLVGHHRRYTKGSLEKLAKAAGFSVEKSMYVDCVGFIASAIYKLLPSRNGTISPTSVASYDRWVFPISQKIDKIVDSWLGKNVYIVAKKY